MSKLQLVGDSIDAIVKVTGWKVLLTLRLRHGVNSLLKFTILRFSNELDVFIVIQLSLVTYFGGKCCKDDIVKLDFDVISKQSDLTEISYACVDLVDHFSF